MNGKITQSKKGGYYGKFNGGIGQFDASAISQMRQNFFNKIDQNSDGSINKTEFADSLEGMVGVSADDIFSKFDSNGNNSISKDEMNAAMDKMDEQMKKNPPPMGMMGGNGPSGIATSSSSNDKTSGIFDSLDTNKDGYVSITELTASTGDKSIANKIMEEIDANKDGQVSQDENDNFLKKMQEKMFNSNSGNDTSYSNSATFQQDLLSKMIEALSSYYSNNSTESSKDELSFYA